MLGFVAIPTTTTTAVPSYSLFAKNTRKFRKTLCACQQNTGNEANHPNTPHSKGGEHQQRAYHEIPTTSVDWDFEWVKYVAAGKINSNPPKNSLLGKRRYSRKFPRGFNFSGISVSTKDWRFWVATLFIVSMILAAIQYSNHHSIVSGFI